MNRKVFGIVILNIIVFIGLLFLMNWVVYKYFYAPLERNYHSSKDRPYDLKRYVLDYKTMKEYYPVRDPFGVNYKRNPIVMFGCSYGFGSPLNPEQTLAYKLSEMLKRPVYN